MHQLIMVVLLAILAAISLFSAGHALIMKRDPRSALCWIGVCLSLPLLGPLLYWLMGINRIRRRALRWQKRGLRLSSPDRFRFRRRPTAATELPPDAGHLADLRSLCDRVVNSPLSSGNHIQPLHCGEQAYPVMLEAIRAAHHSVHLCSYIFDGDDTGQNFVSALQEAAARGVQVRVLVDGLGEKYSRPTVRKLLQGSQVQLCRFLPLRHGGHLNLRCHRKLLLVDGTRAFTGGMNIGDRHMVERTGRPAPVVDVQFSVSGPVVAELQRVFLEDWYFACGQLLDEPALFPPCTSSGTALARAIGDGPDREFRKLHWIVIGALSCARQRVTIMTPYFIPDQALLSALATTALRGIQVTIILPGCNNLPYVHWATQAYLWELLQLGIKVHFQPGPFVHSKLLLVDGVWSLIGSANLDPRSLRLNFELNIEVYDRQLTGILEQHCQAALANSRRVSLRDMDGRSIPVKLRDGMAKLFSPYL